MKNFTEYKESLSLSSPPSSLNVYLQALWYDAKDNWSKAHSLVDSLEDKTACWVHAYLHRKEGDASNAAYWYSRAKTPPCQSSFEEEWEEIASSLLR